MGGYRFPLLNWVIVSLGLYGGSIDFGCVGSVDRYHCDSWIVGRVE